MKFLITHKRRIQFFASWMAGWMFADATLMAFAQESITKALWKLIPGTIIGLFLTFTVIKDSETGT